MKLSVIIPTWSGTEKLAEMAFKLCEYIRPQCDELIVSEDSRNYYEPLQCISDIYLMHDNLGDVINMVKAYPLATGDYLASINSDVILFGQLGDLCLPGRVTSPICTEYGYYKGFQGPFFVVPREILNSHGYLNPDKQGGGADYDYAERTREVFTCVDMVSFSHQGGGRSYSERRRLHEEREQAEKELRSGS